MIAYFIENILSNSTVLMKSKFGNLEFSQLKFTKKLQVNFLGCLWKIIMLIARSKRIY